MVLSTLGIGPSRIGGMAIECPEGTLYKSCIFHIYPLLRKSSCKDEHPKTPRVDFYHL